MAYDPIKIAEEKKAIDAALKKAEERDRKKNVGILQMSKMRFALIESSGLSWSRIGEDETDPASYRTAFSYKFIEDGEGRPLNNLTWKEAHRLYAEFMK